MFPFGVLVFGHCLLSLVWCEKDKKYGVWDVQSMEQCKDSDNFPFTVKLTATHLNGTQDIFNAKLQFSETFYADNVKYTIDIFRMTNDGPKTFLSYHGDYLSELPDTYKEPFLQSIGVDGLPIEAGEYFIKDYIIDYCKHRTTLKPAVYLFEINILDREDTKLGCLRITGEHKPPAERATCWEQDKEKSSSEESSNSSPNNEENKENSSNSSSKKT